MTELSSGLGPDVMAVQVLAPPGADSEELDDLTAMLRAELLELDVADVQPLTAAEAPDGAKGAVAAAGGWLAVHLGPAALRGVVNAVAAWAARNSKTVDLSLGGDHLILVGVSSEQQTEVINEWFRRHPAGT